MIGTIRNNNNNPQSNFDSFSIKQTDQEQLRVFTYQVSAPQVVYITYTTAVSGFADMHPRSSGYALRAWVYISANPSQPWYIYYIKNILWYIYYINISA